MIGVVDERRATTQLPSAARPPRPLLRLHARSTRTAGMDAVRDLAARGRGARRQGRERVPGRAQPAGADQRQEVLSRSTPSASSSTSRSSCARACPGRGCRSRRSTSGSSTRCAGSSPSCKFVTRHGCEPWADLAVKLCSSGRTSTTPRRAFAPKYYPKDVIDFANTRGADKVMYAGYFPMGLSLERIFGEMPDVPFRDHVWPKFLRENAIRVFKLGRVIDATQRSRPPRPGGVGRHRGRLPEVARGDVRVLRLHPQADDATRRARKAASSSSPPATCSRTCPSGTPKGMDDPVQILLAELDRHNIQQAIVTPYDGPRRARAARVPRPLLRGHQRRPQRGHGGGAQDRAHAERVRPQVRAARSPRACTRRSRSTTRSSIRST